MADGNSKGPPEPGQQERRATEWTRLSLSGGPVRHAGRYTQPPEQAADVSAFDELVLTLTVCGEVEDDVEVRLLTARSRSSEEWFELRSFPVVQAGSCATLRLSGYLEYLRYDVAPTSAWADVTGDDGLELPVSASEVTVDEVEGRQIAAVPIAWDAGSASPIGAERSTEKNLGKDQGGLLDVEELRLAPDVCGYDELDLILTVQEDIGSDIEVRLLTATTFEITGVGGRWV